MKKLVLALVAAAIAATAWANKTIEYKCNADYSVKIWDNSSAPHSNFEKKDERQDKNQKIWHTSECVLYIYKAKGTPTGQGVVILPGGGYRNLNIKGPAAFGEYLQSIGITVALVKYRLPNYGHKEVPLEDAEAAIKYLRDHAKELNIDPGKVGVCGSSAGGNLAAYVSTFAKGETKPDFSILFYPVISGEVGLLHAGTILQLLGKNQTPALLHKYCLEHCVDNTTPPTIILLSDDDATVHPENSIAYYEALKEHGVKATMHIYPSGGHAWIGNKKFKYDKEYKAAVKDWLSKL